MKKIYTSNYARQGENPLAIGTSCAMPKWYKGATNSLVAPTWDLVKRYKQKQIDRQQYTHEYLELLKQRNFDAQKFVDGLTDGAVLLCYEAPGDFCHRRLLANYINGHTGITVSEWRNEKEENHFQQQSFVDEMVGF